MKKELKSGIISADKIGRSSAAKSADRRPTVGGVNVIAVLPNFNEIDTQEISKFYEFRFLRF